MDVAAARRTERLIDHGASACLGGASAFAAFAALAALTEQPALGALAVAIGAAAYWLSWRVLRAIAPAAAGALLLDDELPAPESDSTVVRLFDPAAMPASHPFAAAPGRLVNDPPLAAPPDASQALHDALNALRRSLN